MHTILCRLCIPDLHIKKGKKGGGGSKRNKSATLKRILYMENLYPTRVLNE